MNTSLHHGAAYEEYHQVNAAWLTRYYDEHDMALRLTGASFGFIIAYSHVFFYLSSWPVAGWRAPTACACATPVGHARNVPRNAARSATPVATRMACRDRARRGARSVAAGASWRRTASSGGAGTIADTAAVSTAAGMARPTYPGLCGTRLASLGALDVLTTGGGWQV